MSDAPRQRLRVTYRHGPELRFISHLDLIRAVERAVRRAGLPLAYSQGFNPRPRITWAAPLPLGFTGEAEVADFMLNEPLEPAEFLRRLSAQLPAGLTLLSAFEVPRQAPALPAILTQARYRATLPAQRDLEEARRRVTALLASQSIERPRRGKGRGQGVYDLRPRIVSLEASLSLAGLELEMTLSAQAQTSGRPEEVLAALGYGDEPALIARLELLFAVT